MLHLKDASLNSDMTSKNGNYFHEFAEKFKQEVSVFSQNIEKSFIEATSVKQLAEKAKQEFLKVNEL
jgi:hypothetical protein